MTIFRNNFRLEVVSDVIACVSVDYVGMDVHVKFDHSRFNSGLIIQPFADWTPHVHFYAVCIHLHFSATEAFGYVISGRCVRLIVPDETVRFRDPRLNCSQEIQLKAMQGSIFEFLGETRLRFALLG